jgi:hypothetical protein
MMKKRDSSNRSKAIQTAIYIKKLHSALTFSGYVYKILVANFAKKLPNAGFNRKCYRGY